MNIKPTDLREVFVLEPKVFEDDRGFFLESYNQRSFEDVVGYPVRFVQDNHSRSSYAVLRGLHYQLPPRPQGKLVRVSKGRIFDVAVDMRRSSPHFCRWTAVELSAENHYQIWIPPGFAHGFLVLSDSADVLYKATDYYSPPDEGSVRWDDATIAIQWLTVTCPIKVSPRDNSAPVIANARYF